MYLMKCNAFCGKHPSSRLSQIRSSQPVLLHHITRIQKTDIQTRGQGNSAMGHILAQGSAGGPRRIMSADFCSCIQRKESSRGAANAALSVQPTSATAEDSKWGTRGHPDTGQKPVLIKLPHTILQ